MIVDKPNTILVSLIVILLNFPLFGEQPFDDYINEIEVSFAEQMEKDFDLHWNGTANVIWEKVKELGMSFTIHRKATIEEARALELFVIEKFVQAINQHEKIQPYLNQRPFTFEYVRITISFKERNGYNSDGSIVYLFNVPDSARTAYRNHISYFSQDPFEDNQISLLDEPYEEAVKINAKLSIDPLTHQPNEYEEEIDALLADFANDLQEQYGLYRYSIGGNLMNGIQDIGATFDIYQFVTRDEGRQLLLEVSDKLLTTLNNNEKLRPFLKEYPFPASLLKINLRFEQSKYASLPDIRIKNITLNENKITYNQEITHPLKEGQFFRSTEHAVLAIETYPEALKIIEENHQKFQPKFPTFWDYTKDWLYTVFIRIFAFFSRMNG